MIMNNPRSNLILCKENKREKIYHGNWIENNVNKKLKLCRKSGWCVKVEKSGVSKIN